MSKAPSTAPAARERSSLTSPWALAGIGLALAAVLGGVVLVVRRSLAGSPVAVAENARRA